MSRPVVGIGWDGRDLAGMRCPSGCGPWGRCRGAGGGRRPSVAGAGEGFDEGTGVGGGEVELYR